MQRLLDKFTRGGWATRDITDMRWAVDEGIGTRKIKDGATAQMMLVEKDGETLKAGDRLTHSAPTPHTLPTHSAHTTR